jgi:hypothetical protein
MPGTGKEIFGQVPGGGTRAQQGRGNDGIKCGSRRCQASRLANYPSFDPS